MKPIYEVRDSAVGHGFKAIYASEVSEVGVPQMVLVTVLPEANLDALAAALDKQRAKPKTISPQTAGGPLAGLAADSYLVEWNGSTITDATAHGPGCCCNNCPWNGNHGEVR